MTERQLAYSAVFGSGTADTWTICPDTSTACGGSGASPDGGGAAVGLSEGRSEQAKAKRHEMRRKIRSISMRGKEPDPGDRAAVRGWKSGKRRREAAGGGGSFPDAMLRKARRRKAVEPKSSALSMCEVTKHHEPHSHAGRLIQNSVGVFTADSCRYPKNPNALVKQEIFGAAFLRKKRFAQFTLHIWLAASIIWRPGTSAEINEISPPQSPALENTLTAKIDQGVGPESQHSFCILRMGLTHAEASHLAQDGGTSSQHQLHGCGGTASPICS